MCKEAAADKDSLPATNKPQWTTLFYVNCLDAIREAARELGYVVTIHGSGLRNLGLVAVPWVDQVEAPELLVAAICEVTGAVDAGRGLVRGPDPQPHGRLTWLLCLAEGSCLDLSVLPRHDRNSQVEQVRTDLTGLTCERRRELLAAFCQHCGELRPTGRGCQCWNDE